MEILEFDKLTVITSSPYYFSLYSLEKKSFSKTNKWKLKNKENQKRKKINLTITCKLSKANYPKALTLYKYILAITPLFFCSFLVNSPFNSNDL